MAEKHRNRTPLRETDSDHPAEIQHDTTEFNVIFVHSLLDDYGLPASAFRIYCHLSRRAGQNGAWPAVATIAKICRLHPDTVRKSLKLLVAHCMVSPEPRPGRTTLYWLTAPSVWRPPKHIDGNLSEVNAPVSDSEGGHRKEMQGHPSETNVDEGNPIEGDPMNVIHSHPKSAKGSNDSRADAIYRAYPKSVGKPAALREIRRALREHPFDYLLERTELFARICNAPPEYIPHPATWFSQQRFNDDPATWHRSNALGGKVQPKVVRAEEFGRGATDL